MTARFLDGKSARAHTAEVSRDGDTLSIVADARTHTWSFSRLEVAIEAGEARITNPRDRDARLLMPLADWKALAGEQHRGRRRSEVVLVGVLAAIGIGTALFVFVGMPALSGPMARATPVSLEQRMGANFEAQIGSVFQRCDGAAGQAALARFGDRLEATSGTPFDLRVRAVEAPMVNAFALPGGPILITDDLIAAARTPDELAAVIAHEAAHVDQRHVMQAVWRSLGAGLLLDLLIGGGSGAGQQAIILAGQASDLRFSREAETEADRRGQTLLHQLGLSSLGMADFFEQLARIEGAGQLTEATEFLATHPDTRRRVRAAEKIERSGAPAFTPLEWVAIKRTCSARSDQPILRLPERLRRRNDPAVPDQTDQVRPDGQ